MPNPPTRPERLGDLVNTTPLRQNTSANTPNEPSIPVLPVQIALQMMLRQQRNTHALLAYIAVLLTAFAITDVVATLYIFHAITAPFQAPSIYGP